jgi:septum formation protein
MSGSADEQFAALVLASASPRRLELLRRLGLSPEVLPADVDESVDPGEDAARDVDRVARQKAEVVAAARPGAVVLAADTAVVLAGEPLGKPADSADALRMLERHSGRAHEVLTAVAVIGPDGELHTTTEAAVVRMAETSPAERLWYVGTGEPLDKAGGYGVQGAGAVLVRRVEGDPTTVIGLPLGATVALLRAAGLVWPEDAAAQRPS